MKGQFPITPGHEIIRRVAALADNVPVEGNCQTCRKGHFQMCQLGIINGVTKSGGYAQYCILRGEAGVRIPQHMDEARYAPILCTRSHRLQLDAPNECSHLRTGRSRPPRHSICEPVRLPVVALSRDSTKEKFVRELGAHEYIDSSKEEAAQALQKLGGASLIVATAPNAQVISPLVNGPGIMVPGEVSIDIRPTIERGLSIHGWPSGHAIDSEDAIQFTELEGINYMVETYPLQKAREAFGELLSLGLDRALVSEKPCARGVSGSAP
ncbi:hypothetical protein N7474_011233 [Penicillium riverlandense]|uniref:uncharacterized protein n=1 Tax=Penicillium riverlandense TaxID=1903569 RepID=UPI0025471387|nr:uncharacterized protein N7474_011233 [Penicillium riverlandense]KAJ5805346.1 hypothetical protein N7474_011233 [Penicillium riverlandense]